MKSLLQHKWIRVVGWTLLALLALYLLAWLALPPLLKSQAQRIGSEQLGRKLSIGAVAFNPLTLELTIDDVAVATADGAGEQVHVKRLYANAAAESVWRFAPVIDAVTVDGVAVKLTYLGNGRYDIDDVLQKLSKPSEPSPSGKTPRFSLYNLSLANASVDYIDRSIGRTQELRDLALSVPFISSFDSQREVKVAPRLAFTLNGSRFDSGALATPFATDRKTDATITLKGLDLAPYLAYLPASLPVKLMGAKIDADLKLGFEQTPKAAVKLSGTVNVHDLKVADAAGGDLLSLSAVNAVLADVQPLAKIAKLSSLELLSPRMSLRKDASGRLNVAGSPGADAASNAASTQAEPAASAASASSAATIAAPSQPWAVELGKLTLTGGTIGWKDETQPADIAPVVLKDVALEASDITLPFAKPFPFKGSAALDAPHAGRLAFNGTGTDKAASVSAQVDALSLDIAAPYLAAVLQPDLAGRVDADLQIDWAASGALAVTAKTLALSDLVLTSTTSAADADLAEAALVATSASDRRTSAPTAGGSRTTGRGTPASTSARSHQGSAFAAARRSGARTASATSRLDASAASGDSTGARLPRGSLATLKQLKLTDARLDLVARTVAIGRLDIDEPRARVVRDADRHWMYERWLKTPLSPTSDGPAEAASASAASIGDADSASAPRSAPRPAARRAASARTGTPTTPAPTARPWAVTIDTLALAGGAMTFADLANVRPVRFDVSALAVEMKNLSPDSAKPQPISVSTRVGARRSEPGSLSFKGSLATAPLNVQGQIDAKRLPLHAFEPYYAAGLNVSIERADTGFVGKVAYEAADAGPTLAVSGDVQVDNFLADSVAGSPADQPKAAAAAASSASAAAPGGIRGALLAAGAEAARSDGRRPTGSLASTLGRDAGAEELLSWKTLALRGVSVALKPSAPLTVDVKDTAATDLFARLIVKEDGRINLQDLVKSSDEPGTAKGKPAPSGKPSAPPVIRFGPIGVANARVQFSDRFVKPNYSASLTELNGRLSAFASVAPAGAPQLADLELRGRAEGTASLEVTGKLNPLAKPLALDIQGHVRDLELPPLSPYSVKYAGYGIQRGKMSVDVNYVVRPDGQLTATNKVVLNQLTFGDKVEGAPNSLPVKLAVALLADRNGVIDLDLPISGSLNDPQFSLFPVIMKVIGNVVMKAITSPFSLIASAFGGSGGSAGEGLDSVSFALGSTTLDDAARSTLDKVAKALADRPALKMTVTGTSNVDAEREAYRRARLMALVQAEKRKASATSVAATAAASPASGAATASESAAPVTVSAAEYPALLKAVYKSADIVKPRNLIGMAKDLPQDEMESLLLANITVTDESIRELAVDRGVAVRDFLASRNLSLDRLFLGAAKTATEAPAAFEPQAELALAAK